MAPPVRCVGVVVANVDIGTGLRVEGGLWFVLLLLLLLLLLPFPPPPIADAADAAAAAAMATPALPMAPHMFTATKANAWWVATSTTAMMPDRLEHIGDWLKSTTRMRSELQCRWYWPRSAR